MTFRAILLKLGVVAVLAHPATSQECPAFSVSAMRITLSTVQNKTGQWDTKVAFRQGQPGDSHVWMAGVDQNVIQCAEKEPVLETILHLKASPSSGYQESSSPNWVSPWNPAELPHDPKKPARTPPAGYELFPGVGYYKFHPEVTKWTAARRACTAEGGHLIILNSEKENEVAKQIFARYPKAGDWFWAGILEFGIHTEWFTLFGEPLETTGFTRIYPGENNQLGPSDFGVIHRNGEYGDGTIDGSVAFLCEFDL